MSKILKVGDVAPEFDLDASDGNRYKLSEMLQDDPVLLVFYPVNDTPG
jgi:peroxiredoxin